MIYLADGTVHKSPINQHLSTMLAETSKRMQTFMRDSYVAGLDHLGPTLYDADNQLIPTKGSARIGQMVKIKLPGRYKK